MNDSTFQREDRYIVIKRSDLKKVPVSYRSSLVDPMFSLLSHLPRRECLVIESDWPEYESYWQMIERRMTGQPAVTAAEELEAVRHWRGKHAQAIRERDALQLMLNDLEEQNHSLEQRRHAEQQACQAAERRVKELTTFELQPPVEPWFYFVECDDPDYSGLFNHESEAQTQANDHGGEVVRLWNVPPTWRPAEQPAPVAAVLAEAREWLGDGKRADDLAREHWTPEYAALIDRIDATLSK
jgi:hypothetical protein